MMTKASTISRFVLSFLAVIGVSLAAAGCTQPKTTPIDYEAPAEVVPTRVDPTTGETVEIRPVTTEYSFTASADGQTALDVLEENTQITTKKYDYGVFVESINGTFPDEGEYWAFYVNREYAKQGVDSTTLKQGDAITFRLESTTSATDKMNQP